MGMWDKDRSMGLPAEDTLGLNTPFVLFDAREGTEVPTALGKAVPVILTVSQLDETGRAGRRIEVSTFASAVRDKLREREDGDLPAVVMLSRVNTKSGRPALVIRFVEPWGMDVPTGVDAATGEVDETAPASKSRK